MHTEELKEGQMIANEAKRWLGAKHVNGQRTKYIAVDCAMLYLACLEETGLIEKDSMYIQPYSNEWHLHHRDERMLSYFEQVCREVRVDEIQPGDVLLYKFGRCISHAAIYIKENTVIHAVVAQDEVIVSNMNEAMFLDNKGQTRLKKVMRFDGRKYLENKKHGMLGDKKGV